jgi:CHASE2 domain-containing sensor protein
VTAADSHYRLVQWAAHVLRTTPDKIRLWERLIFTAFIVTLLVFGAREANLLEAADAWWLDRMAYADRPTLGAPVVVVAITDENYYDPELFGGMSPLDPDALLHILKRVTEHRPQGVILDILIHPAPNERPDRAAARARLLRFLASATDGPRIILVRDLNSEGRERRADDPNWALFDELTTSAHLAWACPSIRRSGAYVRAVPLRYHDDEGCALNLPTVLGAAVTTFRLEPDRPQPWWADHERTDPTTPHRVRFSGCFLDLGSSLTPHHVDAALVLSQPVVEGARSLLTDKIVLIGGTFQAGRDLLPTVVGNMPGVCVWAEAIASWIRHDTLQEPAAVIVFALEFLVGIIAGLLLARFGPALGLFSGLLILIPLTVLFSMLTFGNRVLFVNFLPSFVGVYLHYQIEVHWEIRSLKRKIVLLLKNQPAKASNGLNQQGG